MSREQALRARAAALGQRTSAASNITLVTGPPCAGKTSWVAEHAKSGQIVIDLDALAQAIGSGSTHDHAQPVVDAAKAARTALIAHARNIDTISYLIAVYPTDSDRANARRIVRLDPGRDECHRRADQAARPTHWHAFIDAWYAHSTR